MSNYKPIYPHDVETRTITRTERLPTMHISRFDWTYPFNDPEHTSCMCDTDARKQEHIAKLKEWLKLIEDNADGEVFASNYGGWPRIWQRVTGFGMASCRSHWTPRPTILLRTTYGTEWVDWLHLTGVEVRGAK